MASASVPSPSSNDFDGTDHLAAERHIPPEERVLESRGPIAARGAGAGSRDDANNDEQFTWHGVRGSITGGFWNVASLSGKTTAHYEYLTEAAACVAGRCLFFCFITYTRGVARSCYRFEHDQDRVSESASNWHDT